MPHKTKYAKKPHTGEPHCIENISDYYLQRFADRCEVQPNGCIYLKGNVQNNGYANWYYRYPDDEQTRIRYITAHRFAALTSGKFSEADVNDYCVLHDCDQNYAKDDISYRQCVNPDHLFLGTVQDNALDCVAKGRNYKMAIQKGSDNYNAKLTDADAQYIIDNHYVISQVKLAKQFGVVASTIESIHYNRTWKHLPR